MEGADRGLTVPTICRLLGNSGFFSGKSVQGFRQRRGRVCIIPF